MRMIYSLDAAQRAIYRRYAGLALPRHTSYPIAPVWSAEYGPEQFREDVAELAASGTDVGLYVHVPFCKSLCYYCACTKEIVPSQHPDRERRVRRWLEGMSREIRHLAAVASQRRWRIRQVHLGGGSPTYLNARQIESLAAELFTPFDIDVQAELAIEIDPRITSFEQLQLLRSLRFNRVSLGVQDFDPVVQRAVNRDQPFEQVERCVRWCRQLGFTSVNFDLIYGLPYQTPATMAATLEKTLSLSPDRVAFYRLAVIPDMFRWQRTFSQTDLPVGEEALELNLLAINMFLEAGYEFIGLDHFAKPGELLSLAARQGTLQRNFQGMTTGKELPIIGLGPSAISQLPRSYAQNAKTTEDWTSRVATDFATVRGLRLSDDDVLRREVLQQLYGYGRIDRQAIEERFGIEFASYFARETPALEHLADEGVVEITPESISLTMPLGRLLARVVGSVFDRYLPADAWSRGLPTQAASKVG